MYVVIWFLISPKCDSIPISRSPYSRSPLYQAKDEKKFTSLIAMQPLVPDHAFMPHLKAMYVSFHMAYSGLICSKGLPSDRPK